MATPTLHFQSVYRRYGLVICEPLCGPEPVRVETSPLKHEVTCRFCLRLLTEMKEYGHA